MTSDRGSVMRVHAGVPLLACELISQHWPEASGKTSHDELDRGSVFTECSHICQLLCFPPFEDDL